MLGLDSMVPLVVVVSSPPKMFGWDDEREPSGKVVSKPPKMFGVEEEYPSGLVQSCPPKMLGWQETWALPGRGRRGSFGDRFDGAPRIGRWVRRASPSSCLVLRPSWTTRTITAPISDGEGTTRRGGRAHKARAVSDGCRCEGRSSAALTSGRASPGTYRPVGLRS